MKQRCLNPNSKQYKNYGERGVAICERWLESYDNFFSDMGLKPDGLTLDRIDNDASYSPENCRWATKKEQRRNQRTCHFLEFEGRRLLLREWAEEKGINELTLSYRLLRLGWSVEKALSTPALSPHEVAKIARASQSAMAAKDGQP
jgi:hypothetical protein